MTPPRSIEVTARKSGRAGRFLSAATYLDKVRGAWTGKFIGGTLGAPVEGVKEAHAFSAAKMTPPAMMENDDTDMQLLWLHALQEHGLGLGSAELIMEWREHAMTPWGEYGVARFNWDRGITAPESGRQNNWFYSEGMGCPIRAEIWGLICPGSPMHAARFAAMDAQVDHAGNAVEAEKFCAAMVAAAFFESDVRRLVDCGFAAVDPNCRFAAMVRDVRVWVEGGDWRAVRALVLRHYGHPEMTHCMQNLGFIILALLLGKGDFLTTMFTALNCGFDSDCTAATAGAVIGTVLGFQALPAEWTKATGDRYVISACMQGFPRDGSILELSRACCVIGEGAAATLATGVQIERAATPPPPPLPVVRQAVTPVRIPAKAYPTWRIVGPFWRNWDERKVQDFSLHEHGMPSLPSTAYMSHCLSGMDREFLDASRLDFTSPLPEQAGECWREATESRLPLQTLDGWGGPAVFYVVTEFSTPVARDSSWLLIGSTGPYQAWLDGQAVGTADSYQCMSPHNFALPVSFSAGHHRLVLKLERTSQPLGASVIFKHHEGKHWHQAFYDEAIEWSPAQACQAGAVPARNHE